MSLVLWLLVVVAVLWCCAEVAVSLSVFPPTRRRRVDTPHQSQPRRSRWIVTFVGAVILAGIGVLLWQLGFETTSQLLWFLVVVALLWCCAQVSFLLRPDERSASASWGRRRTWLDRFFPGASMRSGIYNRGDEEVWDGNEKLPPHY